jgi:hypothetical protein
MMRDMSAKANQANVICIEAAWRYAWLSAHEHLPDERKTCVRVICYA